MPMLDPVTDFSGKKKWKIKSLFACWKLIFQVCSVFYNCWILLCWKKYYLHRVTCDWSNRRRKRVLEGPRAIWKFEQYEKKYYLLSICTGINLLLLMVRNILSSKSSVFNTGNSWLWRLVVSYGTLIVRAIQKKEKKRGQYMYMALLNREPISNRYLQILFRQYTLSNTLLDLLCHLQRIYVIN